MTALAEINKGKWDMVMTEWEYKAYLQELEAEERRIEEERG